MHSFLARRRLAVLWMGAAFVFACGQPAAQPGRKAKAETWNLRLLGASDLQGRGAFQAVVRRQGERVLALVGHTGGDAFNPLTRRMEINGTSIADVTDPARPRLLAHIAGERGEPDRGGARAVRYCSGQELPAADPAKAYLLRSLGESGHQVWNIANPEQPELVAAIPLRVRSTHRAWWECDTGIAYLIAGDPMWRSGRMLEVFDLSNPSRPVFVRGFGLPGQEPGGNGPVPPPMLSVYSSGPEGNRVYLAYGVPHGGVLQVLNREKLLRGPREYSRESLVYPQIVRRDLPGAATPNLVQPLLGVEMAEFANQGEGRTRDYLAILGRPLRKDCQEQRQMLWMLDVTDELRPFGASNWTVNETAGRYCARGGRFGAVSANDPSTAIFHRRILFVAHMNAGVRALDVRNPLAPREIAYFVPEVGARTFVLASRAAAPSDASATRPAPERPVVQTGDVQVDERGYIYTFDRAGTGMHVLELSGAARRIADWKAARP